MLTLLAFFSVRSAAPLPAHGECSLDDGYHYYGFDITAGQYQAGSRAECARLCLARHDCAVFTYVWGQCWLKSSNAGRIAHPIASSGDCRQPEREVATAQINELLPRLACSLEYGFDYYGFDLAGQTIVDGGVLGCAAECQKRWACKAFTYIWGSCWCVTPKIKLSAIILSQF